MLSAETLPVLLAISVVFLIAGAEMVRRFDKKYCQADNPRFDISRFAQFGNLFGLGAYYVCLGLFPFSLLSMIAMLSLPTASQGPVQAAAVIGSAAIVYFGAGFLHRKYSDFMDRDAIKAKADAYEDALQDSERRYNEYLRQTREGA